MARTYEMLWNCQFCGTEKLLAKTHKHCPNCGGAQDPSWRYFPSDAEKVAVEGHVYVGADWICSACQSPNANNATHCTQCGGGKDGATTAPRRHAQERAQGKVFHGETEADARAERAATSAPIAELEEPRHLSATGVIGLLVVGLVLVLIGLALFWKDEVQLTVVGHNWERSIDVERFAPTSASDWCGSIPADAYRISRTREVRSHDQVPDGQECRTVRSDNGDGTYSESESCTTKYRDVPVYDDRCHYSVNRWLVARTEVERGASRLETRRWPDVRLAQAGVCLGCERKGAHRDRYVVNLEREDKKTVTCTFNESKWAGFVLGSRWQTRQAVITGRVDCDEMRSLAP
jgi:hypothetical protein